MSDETRPRDLEQVLLPAEPAPQINTVPVVPKTIIAKFRVLPLCCLFLLFSVHVGLILGVERSNFFFLAAIQCFGHATIAIAVAFNRLQVCLVGEDDESTATKIVWALKYLWEIHCNFVLYTFLLPFQVYLAIQSILLSNSEVEFNIRNVYDIAVIVGAVLTWILFLFVACVADRFSKQLKLKQIHQPNEEEEQELCVTHRIFTGFQISSKIWIFITLYFFTDTRIPQVLVALVLISWMFYLACQHAMRFLFWTPSPMIFKSIEIQSRVIDETMWFYVGMGLIVLCFQTQGIWSALQFDGGSHTQVFVLGLLFARMLHILLCVLMNAMAINIRKPKLGARYFVVDIILSILNLIFGIVSGMVRFEEMYHVYWRILLLLGLSIKLGMMVFRMCQDIDAQVKQNRFIRDLRILSVCVAMLGMMLIPTHIAVFWLINITAAHVLYSFSMSNHLRVPTDEHRDEGISI